MTALALSSRPQLNSESGYRPRSPKSGLLYQVLEREWAPFVRERELPHYIEEEFTEFFKCGVPEYGVARLSCDDCKSDILVPFSCKKRGFCPSCTGKRMNQGALFWVDHIFPRVPVRQWVLSFPMPVRFWMAKNPKLMSALLAIFMRVVHRHYGKTGSITVIQRFGSALNLNIHFHALFLEGAYCREAGEELRFVPARAPTTEEIQLLLAKVQTRMLKHLRKKGLVPSEEGGSSGTEDTANEEANVLSILQGASVLNRPIRKVGSLGVVGERAVGAGPLSAILGGFSLHAAVLVPSGDRKRLEQMCRYLLRPPLSEARLKKISEHELQYDLKSLWRDGTRAIRLTPRELVEKIVALIPQPRIHLTRFHGVLAPNSKDREYVVPPPTVDLSEDDPGQSKEERRIRARAVSHLSWSELLARVFQIEVNVCALCGGKLKFREVILNPTRIRELLKAAPG